MFVSCGKSEAARDMSQSSGQCRLDPRKGHLEQIRLPVKRSSDCSKVLTFKYNIKFPFLTSGSISYSSSGRSTPLFQLVHLRNAVMFALRHREEEIRYQDS